MAGPGGQETLEETWARLESLATRLAAEPAAATQLAMMASDMAPVLDSMGKDPGIGGATLPTADELARDIAIYGLMSTLAWAEWEVVPHLGLHEVAKATFEILAQMTVGRQLDNLITWRLFGDTRDESPAEGELERIEMETRRRLGYPSTSRILV